MNGVSENGKISNFEKAYPGCLGRMVNLFELNLGVSANKLLTDKPHRDGSPISRSNSDVSRVSPSIDPTEDKVLAAGLRNIPSNRKSGGTPMKMLIAQEMSKEVNSRCSPPNLVAKLMGLDSLPQQQPESMQRSHFKGHPRSHSEIPVGNWEQQNGFFHYLDANECKDVYEIWDQSQKFRHKGRDNETTNDKKMALVQQKFAEAKRMATDEKLRQSKQFQDAIEVLNSNKDLFLKCMQEPNSVFSQQLYNLQSISHLPETKRITVLRPSKMAEGKLNAVDKSHLESPPPGSWKNHESPTQPTRIVVLKPSLGIINNKAMVSPESQSSRIQSEDFLVDVEDDVNKESNEVGKTITQQMREKLGKHHRDETLISSVFSNGYVADESSFNRSEIEYPAGNLSDSEVMSPVSRHSWDYVNRLGSPYSPSSFSRASYSPESSVCREAKKRLSERWAMVSSNGTGQEQQRHVPRSSSTLGEMLALSETKKTKIPGKEGSSNEGPRSSNSLLGSEQGRDENVDSSPRNLMRSKSVPVSSTQFGTRLNADVSVSNNNKIVPKEETNERSSKSSFKGKVSSLFFSRNKKTSKDRGLKNQTKEDLSSAKNLPGEGPNHQSSGLMEPSHKESLSNLIFKQGKLSPQTGMPLETTASGNPGENQDQPSPISVLDPPFEENERLAKVFAHYPKPDPHSLELPINSASSNLVDKSPPIGSIARTLLRVDMEAASSYTRRESSVTQATEDEQREWFFFAETLLSAAGLQDEVQFNSYLTRFYSHESPLDPSLRDKYIDLNDKVTLHEAKRRQKRSLQKLVFDCVNSALLDIAVSAQQPSPCTELSNSTLEMENVPLTIVDKVWARLNTWFSGEMSYCGDDNSLVVEWMVQKEVVGKGWIENVRLETDNLGSEIEGKLLEELVLDTLVELTGCHDFHFVPSGKLFT